MPAGVRGELPAAGLFQGGIIMIIPVQLDTLPEVSRGVACSMRDTTTGIMVSERIMGDFLRVFVLRPTPVMVCDCRSIFSSLMSRTSPGMAPV